MIFLPVQHACRHRMSHLLLVVLLLYSGAEGSSEAECESRKEVCGMVSGRQGIITSPGYPRHYPDRVCCAWAFDLRPSEILILRVHDLDVEEDGAGGCGGARPCCRHSWLALPQRSSAMSSPEGGNGGGGGVRRLCGRGRRRLLMKALPPRAVLKFYTSKVQAPGRGFNLSYSIETAGRACVRWDERPCGGAGAGCFNASQRCDGRVDCASGADERGCRVPLPPPPEDEDSGGEDRDDEDEGEAAEVEDDFCLLPGALRCRSGPPRCYRHSALCDGRPDCADFSDEVNCGYCPNGHALCGPEGGHCFNPLRQRCDGHIDCPCGEDEFSCDEACPGLLSCGAAGGCFSVSALRAPDGRVCSALPVPLPAGTTLASALVASAFAATPAAHKFIRFRCENGECVAPAQRCDGQDDCGDASDERLCAKNSVITAAIVGSLACALLLVVGGGCLRRAYVARLHATHGSASSAAAAAAAALGLPPPLPPGMPPPQRHRPPPPPPPHHLYAEALLLAREPPPAYSAAMAESEAQALSPLQRPLPPPPPPQGEARGRSRPRRHAPSRRALRQRPSAPTLPAASGPTLSLSLSPAAHAAASHAATVETSLAMDRNKRHSGTNVGVSASSSTSSPSPSRESATSSTSLLSCLSATVNAVNVSSSSPPSPPLLLSSPPLPPSTSVDDDAPLLHA